MSSLHVLRFVEIQDGDAAMKAIAKTPRLSSLSLHLFLACKAMLRRIPWEDHMLLEVRTLLRAQSTMLEMVGRTWESTRTTQSSTLVG
uniref:Uncharacterized protein n=1 Tax=Arundo donax TaxID=35708 RepID=A0A0A9E486_ARUDO